LFIHKSLCVSGIKIARGISGQLLLEMRIRILQHPVSPSIDGIRLDRFEPGDVCEVGPTVGSLLLAEGWAEPAPDEKPASPDSAAARETESPPTEKSPPPNLVRETFPPYFDHIGSAADDPKRRR
jgi:hypothetical protein